MIYDVTRENSFILDLIKLRNAANKPEPYQRKYDDFGRWYKINGEWQPSVTTVLNYLDKPALEIWKQRTSKFDQFKIKQHSSRVGDLIHYQCMNYWILKEKGQDLYQDIPNFVYDLRLDYLLEKYNGYLEKGWELFTEFLDVFDSKIEMIDVEKTISNKKIGYAGRFDLMFYLYEGGRKIPCLGDIKTSKAVYFHSLGAQLAAYNYALDNWAERLYTLRIHPYWNDGRFHWEFVRIPPQIQAFAKCRELMDTDIKLQQEADGQNV